MTKHVYKIVAWGNPLQCFEKAQTEARLLFWETEAQGGTVSETSYNGQNKLAARGIPRDPVVRESSTWKSSLQ